MTFKESETLSAGNEITTFTTEYGVFGLGICYDMRFAPLAQIAAARGAQMLIYPGAFNTTTGPLHYELLLRARAVDNQVYVAGIAPALDENFTYKSWGHSAVVDPWAKVIASCGSEPATVYADIDFDAVDTVRAQIPVRSQARHDMYAVTDHTKPKP